MEVTVQDQNEWEEDDASRKERHRGDRSLTVAESGVASEMVESEEVAVCLRDSDLQVLCPLNDPDGSAS